MERGDDPYGILNVSKTATDQEIKASYRKLALRLHPDKNPDDHEAAASFARVAQAYQLLIDRHRRDRYDLRQRCGADGFDGNTDYDTGNTVQTTPRSSSTVPSTTSKNKSRHTSTSTKTPTSYQPTGSTPTESNRSSSSETVRVTLTGNIPEEFRNRFRDPQELFRAMFAKEYGHDPDFLKDDNRNNIRVVVQPSGGRGSTTTSTTTTTTTTTTTKSARATTNTTKKTNKSKQPVIQKLEKTQSKATKSNMATTIPSVRVKKSNARCDRKDTVDSSEQRSMRSSTRQVLHPDGSIETITETTYTYMDGRTESMSESSIRPPASGSSTTRSGQLSKRTMFVPKQ